MDPHGGNRDHVILWQNFNNANQRWNRIVSALDREIESVTRRPIRGVIQTDAAINPGISGGPLIDSAGRLIGVNTAIYSPSGGSAGIGFAIPVDEVNRIVPRLIRDGGVEPVDRRTRPHRTVPARAQRQHRDGRAEGVIFENDRVSFARHGWKRNAAPTVD